MTKATNRRQGLLELTAVEGENLSWQKSCRNGGWKQRKHPRTGMSLHSRAAPPVTLSSQPHNLLESQTVYTETISSTQNFARTHECVSTPQHQPEPVVSLRGQLGWQRELLSNLEMVPSSISKKEKGEREKGGRERKPVQYSDSLCHHSLLLWTLFTSDALCSV